MRYGVRDDAGLIGLRVGKAGCAGLDAGGGSELDDAGSSNIVTSEDDAR